MTTEEAKVPYAPQAEHTLLNLAIHNSDLLEMMVDDGITSNMFFNSKAATVYELFSTMFRETGRHPTQINIQSTLKSKNLVEELVYYKKLYQEPQDKGYFTRNLRIFLNAYKKREVLRSVTTLAQMAQDELIDFEAIAMTNAEIFERLELFGHNLEIKNGKALMQEMEAEYAAAAERPKGNLWGIGVLDKATKGTRLGEFTLFKGQEGNGKSAFLQQTAYYRATQLNPRPQLWITIGDMTATQIMNRIMQQQHGVSSTNLAEGRFTDIQGWDKQQEVYSELKRLPEIPFYIIEGGWMKSSDLKRAIKSALRHEKTFDVYIDYLQQFSDPGDPYEATTKMSRNVRELAHSLRDESGQNVISITAISGMNKDGEHFGAKALAHDPENIFQISMEKPSKDKSKDGPLIDKRATIFVEKQRGGAMGFNIDLWFEGRYTRFSQYQNQDKNTYGK